MQNQLLDRQTKLDIINGRIVRGFYMTGDTHASLYNDLLWAYDVGDGPLIKKCFNMTWNEGFSFSGISSDRDRIFVQQTVIRRFSEYISLVLEALAE